VSIDPGSKARTVRMHPSVQTAVRAYLPPADFEQAVLAAAEALLQAWPEADESQVPHDQAPLVQALRDCAAPGRGRCIPGRAAAAERAVEAGSPSGPVPQRAEPGGRRTG